MDLANVIRNECIVPDTAFDDKAAALDGVVHAALRSPLLSDIDETALLQAFVDREALGSTGFGKGIAIPHCQLSSVQDFVVGILTVPSGVDFQAVDGQPVRLIVFIVAPQQEPRKHLLLLSAISQALLVKGAVAHAVAALDPSALRASLLRHSPEPTRTGTAANLVQVFVRDEDLFRDIIKVLAAAELSSLVVVEAKNADEYLSYVPLFAAFGGGRRHGRSRIVFAVVEPQLLDAVLENIESITGDLDRCTRAMVIVHRLTYLAGSLTAEV